MIYIALLRGINVSGQKAIKMNDLMMICDSLTFKQPSTYLQSGNIIFVYEITDPKTIANKIATAILERYNFEVSVLVRTIDEFKSIVANNPYISKLEIDIDKLHITFLSDYPKDNEVSKIEINKEDNELFMIKEREVYLYCPNGYGRTKLTNQTFERKLKVITTTRNWKTTCALLEIAMGKME